MKNRKTNEEIKKIIKDCIMKNNDIYNISAIMKHTGLMKKTIIKHKDEVIEEIKQNSRLVENVSNNINNKKGKK